MDPAGLARGQAPGPQRGRRVPAPAPGTPGSVSAKPARLSLIAGHAHPGRIRTSSQPDPARSMTRIRQPDSGIPRAHQSGKPGKLKGLRRVRANPAAIWMTRRLTASEPPPTPHSVVWGDEAAALISVMLSSGSWQTARVSAVCSALLSCIFGRGCLCREPARPARRRARHGALRSGDRGGDRGGRRCRLRDGIRPTCAGRLLPATTWPLRRGRARRSCSRAGPRARARCRRWWYRRCHGLERPGRPRRGQRRR